MTAELLDGIDNLGVNAPKSEPDAYKVKFSKATMVQEAVEKLGFTTSAANIQNYIKAKFNATITPAYIYCLKNRMRENDPTIDTKEKTSRKNFTFETLRMGKKLISLLGGNPQLAHQVIDLLVLERDNNKDITERYNRHLEEIDKAISGGKLPHKEKLELLAEKKKITALLKTLNEF